MPITNVYYMSTEKVGRSAEPPEKQKIESDKRERQRVERVREVDPEEQSRMRKKFRSRMEEEEEPTDEQPSPLDMMARAPRTPRVGAMEGGPQAPPQPPTSSSLPPPDEGEENEGLPADPDFWRDVEFSTPSSQQQQPQQQQQTQQQQEQQRTTDKSEGSGKKRPLTAEEKKKMEDDMKKGTLPVPEFMKEKQKKAQLPGFSKEQQKMIPAKMKPKETEDIPDYPNLVKKGAKTQPTALPEKEEKKVDKKTGFTSLPTEKKEKEPPTTISERKRAKAESKDATVPMPSTKIEKKEGKQASKKEETVAPFPTEKKEEAAPREVVVPKEKKEKEAKTVPKKEQRVAALPTLPKEKEEQIGQKGEKKKGAKTKEQETTEIAPVTAPPPKEDRVHKEKQQGPKGIPQAPSIQDLPAPVKATSAQMTESAKPYLRTGEIRELFRQMVGTIVVMSTPKGDSKTQIILNADNFKSPLFHGMTITVERFSTNPYSFNVRLSGSPQAINVVNDNIEGLRSAFERNKDRFHVARLDTSYTTERPLFHRKEKAGSEGEMGETGEEK